MCMMFLSLKLFPFGVCSSFRFVSFRLVSFRFFSLCFHFVSFHSFYTHVFFACVFFIHSLECLKCAGSLFRLNFYDKQEPQSSKLREI